MDPQPARNRIRLCAQAPGGRATLPPGTRTWPKDGFSAQLPLTPIPAPAPPTPPPGLYPALPNRHNLTRAARPFLGGSPPSSRGVFMELPGKVVLLTGGARIGVDVALALAGRGARVALAYRSSERAARDTVARIRDAGGEAEAFAADLAAPEACVRLVEAVAAALGSVDILLNMASIYREVPLHRQDASTWDEDFEANARSAYLLSLAVAAGMKHRGAGRIINFSDWTAESGRPRYKGLTSYYAAKRAVGGLTEALALELAPRILVNAIAPGPILPPPDLDENQIDRVARATPLERWGGAAEVVKAVLFLVETDFITGECIRVDGGRHLV